MKRFLLSLVLVSAAAAVGIGLNARASVGKDCGTAIGTFPTEPHKRKIHIPPAPGLVVTQIAPHTFRFEWSLPSSTAHCRPAWIVLRVFGPSSPLKLSFPAAAKTGTTDDNRDSWTLGYTPELAIGVWVGNSNNDEMLKVTGAIGAAVIWHNMMQTFYDNPDFVDLLRDGDGKLQRDFVQPKGLITDTACSAKGPVTDLFLREAPPTKCTTYKDPNKQLHAAPSNNGRPTPGGQPGQRPTPIPGIIYPTPQP